MFHNRLDGRLIKTAVRKSNSDVNTTRVLAAHVQRYSLRHYLGQPAVEGPDGRLVPAPVKAYVTMNCVGDDSESVTPALTPALPLPVTEAVLEVLDRWFTGPCMAPRVLDLAAVIELVKQGRDPETGEPAAGLAAGPAASHFAPPHRPLGAKEILGRLYLEELGSPAPAAASAAAAIAAAGPLGGLSAPDRPSRDGAVD